MRRHGEKLKREPIRIRLFLSFYAFLLLPVLLLGIVAMRWSFSTLMNNAVSAYTAAMKNTGERLEEAVQGMTKAVTLFAKDSTISRLAYMRGDSVDYSRISLTQLQEYKKQLILHCTNSGLYDDIVLCFPQKDCIVSTLGIWRLEWLWEDEFHILNQDPDIIRQNLDKNLLIPGLEISVYGYAKRGAAFLRQGITSATGKPLMCVLFWVNESTLKGYLRDLELYPSAMIGLLDEQGRTICTNGEQPPPTDFDALLAQEQRTVVGEDGVQYEKLEWTQPSSGWTYKVLVPQSAIYGNAHEVTLWIAAIMGVVAVLGGFMSWELAALNYRPLGHLFRTLGEYFKDVSSPTKMDEVEKKLLDMLREQDELRKSAGANRELLQYAALTHLLEGGEAYQALTHQTSLAMLGIKMPYRFNRAALCYGVQDEEKLIGTTRAACLGTAVRCYAVRQGETVTLLMNYQAREGHRPLVQAIAPLCRALCLSSMQPHIQGYAQAYEEAKQTLARRRIDAPDNVYWFEELPAEKSTWYPEDVEHQLLCEVRAGNGQTALKVLDQLLKRNDDALTLRHLLITLEVSLLKTDDGKGGLADQLRSIERPRETPDIEGGVTYARALVSAAAEYHQCNAEAARSELANKVLLYIDEHICSEQLSLASTAEQFSLSSAYLSRYFKETFGVGYLDYVNRKRVLLAKEMLAVEQCKVREAAQRVGVGNDATLRRLFKKYEGVVPSSLTE
ncbi:MAG: helix-turn-helix domain-containing protein [Eubacteriales bacterium]|nr:helix-turn-helix domain-containing protein [Eubacteriales bacterium]